MAKGNGEELVPLKIQMPAQAKKARGHQPAQAAKVRGHQHQHLDQVITIQNILQFLGGSLVVYLDIPNSEETLIFDSDG